MNITLSDDTITALTRRYRALAADVAALQDEMTTIKARIDDAVEVGFKLDVDGVPVAKRAGNREFCKITAISLLSPEQKEACKATVYVDKTIRKTVEDAGLLAQCMIEKPDAKPQLKLS